MWRVFWISAAIAGVLSALLLWVSSTATFLFHHPRTAGVRVEIDKVTGSAVVVQNVSLDKPQLDKPQIDKSPAPLGAQPQAVTQATEFDFGIVDPLTSGRHEFAIENAGQAPLKLTVGPTSCKCTVSGLDKREIAPGEQAIVTLEWNTGRTPLYSHTAAIYTNDPSRKSLDFWVSGKVRLQLGADVPEIVLADVKPNESAVAERFIYSQVWDDFEIQSLDSRLDGLAWEVTRVEPARAPGLSAGAVQRLRVTIPAAGLSPRFSDTLRMRIKAAGEEELQTLDLPIHGNVLGRYTVYGESIDGDAVVFGSVPFGKGKKTKLLIKVRDAELALGAPQIEVVPNVLRVQLTPRSEAGAARGLYDLSIELPADAPICQYLGTPQGKVTIRTNHPRIKQIDFPVRFAVVERRND